jgi:hypothetical protein
MSDMLQLVVDVENLGLFEHKIRRIGDRVLFPLRN